MPQVNDRDHNEILRDHDRSINENRHDIKGLRQVVDIQFAQIQKNIDELKNILKWAGGLIVSLMLSFMAWALLQQYNANEATKQDLQQQLNILREQERTRREVLQGQGQIRESLSPTGEAQTTQRQRQ